MGNFNRDGDSKNNRRSFGRGRKSYKHSKDFRGHSNYGSNRGDRQMFKVVCSNCGKDCEVPFRPTGNKPVYCSDCFEKMGNKDDRKPFDRSRRAGRNHSNDKYKSQFESVNAKLDKILNLLQSKDVAVTSAPLETAVSKSVKETGSKSTKSKKIPKEKVTEETEQSS